MCETGRVFCEANVSERSTFSCRAGGSCWLVMVVGWGEARAAPASVHRTVVSGWGACGACGGADVARLGPRFWRAPGGGAAGGAPGIWLFHFFPCLASAMRVRWPFDEGRVIIQPRAVSKSFQTHPVGELLFVPGRGRGRLRSCVVKPQRGAVKRCYMLRGASATRYGRLLLSRGWPSPPSGPSYALRSHGSDGHHYVAHKSTNADSAAGTRRHAPRLGSIL